MSDDWRPIETAPRDGTIIEVMDPDCGTFAMLWNPSGWNELFSADRHAGIWEDPGGQFTWCEDRGFGPTYWRPLRAAWEAVINRQEPT